MRFRIRARVRLVLVALGVGCFAVPLTAPVAALAAEPLDSGPTAEQKKRAAEKFDEGVQRYGRAEFGEAARAFVEADRLVPNPQAITNAIAAARRANDHLLVAKAALQAIARADADPALAASAREALADASTRLARVELRCDADPCALSLDGAAMAGGTEYVLPGTHVVEARGKGDERAEERLSCVAGALYRVALRPAAETSAKAATVVVPAKSDARSTEMPARTATGLPPAVFFVGVGVTAVLAGLTTWSGVDALAARRALPAANSQEENDDVLARAYRTDGFLIGTLVAGAGTAVTGIWFTNWQGGRSSASVVPIPGGAVVTARGDF